MTPQRLGDSPLVTPGHAPFFGSTSQPGFFRSSASGLGFLVGREIASEVIRDKSPGAALFEPTSSPALQTLSATTLRGAKLFIDAPKTDDWIRYLTNTPLIFYICPQIVKASRAIFRNVKTDEDCCRYCHRYINISAPPVLIKRGTMQTIIWLSFINNKSISKGSIVSK